MAAMAAATMTMAMSTTQIARLTHTNFTQNGAVLRLAGPIVSISCTFRSTATRRLNCSPLDSLTATFEDSESESATESSPSGIAAPQSSPSELAAEEQDLQQEGNKLYIGNLPWSYTSSQLAEAIQQHGDVEVVEVVYDAEQNRSRGFAFITMASIDDARAVITALDGKELGGRVLKVNFPRLSTRNPRVSRPAGTRGWPGNMNKLFVSNFPWSCDDEALTVLFSGYGTVLDAKVVYDKETGRSRGYAFVTLSSAEEVNAALESLNGADYGGRELKVVLVHEKKPSSSPQE